MTSLAQILAASGIDPKTSGVDAKSLYTPVHVGAAGAVLRGKEAVKAAGKIEKTEDGEQAPVYKIKFNADPEHWLAQFITVDQDMCALKDKVRRIMDLGYPVLIHGETGTGKELIAKSLHSKRIGQFVDINCGGFPEHLIESELFGHVKGAFTGADSNKQGLFQAANGGTIFLDEIGELPMLMQCKLLRALQERVVRRVGSVHNEKIECRVVAASHCNLNELVAAGKFREDLLWRMNTIELYIKPLRERMCDVPYILTSLGSEVTMDHIEKLLPLSGNVRQIQQIIIRHKYNL